MLIHFIISLALNLSPAVASPVSLAARAPDLIKEAELIVLPISCHPIYNLVTLVINRSGRPFCSDYIGIPTETIKYFETATETEYSTQTHTISETTTLVDRTLTETSAATTTEVISLTSTDTTTLTKYVTEFSTRTSLVYARTVTQWSDLEPVQRRQVQTLEPVPTAPPQASVPPYLRPFAPAAISSACSCLETSTVSETITETITSTVTSLRLATQTEVHVSGVASIISTTSSQTVYQTSYARHVTTILDTATTTSVTTTRVHMDSTLTVHFVIPTQCANAWAEGRVYSRYSYTTPTSYFIGGAAYIRMDVPYLKAGAICCAHCFASEDCFIWQLRTSADLQSFSGARCHWLNHNMPRLEGVSDVCPMGPQGTWYLQDKITDPVSWADIKDLVGAGPCIKPS